MEDRTHLEAECRWCGTVHVATEDFRCAFKPGAPHGLCEFSCPLCSRPLWRGLPASAIKTLLLLGAGPIEGRIPYELLEDRSGRSLSWDEILDVHDALEQTCCPQDELVGDTSNGEGGAA